MHAASEQYVAHVGASIPRHIDYPEQGLQDPVDPVIEDQDTPADDEPIGENPSGLEPTGPDPSRDPDKHADDPEPGSDDDLQPQPETIGKPEANDPEKPNAKNTRKK